MSQFSDRIQAFNLSLQLDASLPAGVSVMNPFRDGPLALHLSRLFYEKFYADNQPRRAILGINPGRFGGALSGIPFTDFKRLEQYCGISAEGHRAHEPSSEFVYRMITSMDTVKGFYARFYISSVCPLGFVIGSAGGKSVNYNYYDDKELYAAVEPFIISSIRGQIGLGLRTDECFCMGVKNGTFLTALNDRYRFFGKVTVLPHPRYIMQYRRRFLEDEIAGYRVALGKPDHL